MKCEYCEGTGQVEDQKCFWETEGIYDRDGDLLCVSLIGVTLYSLQYSLYICYEFNLELLGGTYE